jgi:hypothetical protein
MNYQKAYSIIQNAFDFLKEYFEKCEDKNNLNKLEGYMKEINLKPRKKDNISYGKKRDV